MDIRITPSRLAGSVTPPPSKSMAHRALIAAGLAGSEGAIGNLASSQDIDATRRCMALMIGKPDHPLLDCGESGSTLRFLIPVALALRGGGRFTGHGRLMERPQKPYFDIFDEKGISYGLSHNVLQVRGHLTPGTYALPGNVSSQFVTGLLYALPLLNGDSEIVLTSPLESRAYVAMTVDVLHKFGVTVENHAFRRFFIPGGQNYTPCELAIEPDWSQAAFWYAAKFTGAELEVRGMDPASSQGDRIVAELYDCFPDEIDVSQCPDLLPPLAVMAALRERKTTRFINAARLRLKESDRIATVAAMLSALGVQTEERPDALTVYGTGTLTGGTVDGAGDHRIVMSAAIAATRSASPVTILGAEAVGKSYPTFFDDYKALGGVFHVL